ncbi:MAG: phage holin family protein, partial [Actinomycetota bacterium]|nr:phage holin family protein [Actinomycetota bacterium]
MHTPGGDGIRSAGLGDAAKQVADRARDLVRLELELAKIEQKEKLRTVAVGIALGLAAALVVLYALGFALAGG